MTDIFIWQGHSLQPNLLAPITPLFNDPVSGLLSVSLCFSLIACCLFGAIISILGILLMSAITGGMILGRLGARLDNWLDSVSETYRRNKQEPD